MWFRIVLRLSIELEVENWRLTRRGLLYQYFESLSARSVKRKNFEAKRHLPVFYIMRSCFLDAAQTRLGSNQPNQSRAFLRLRHFQRKNLEASPLKSRQI